MAHSGNVTRYILSKFFSISFKFMVYQLLQEVIRTIKKVMFSITMFSDLIALSILILFRKFNTFSQVSSAAAGGKLC